MKNQKQDEVSDFKKKRQDFSINIRKSNRQQIFNKRRKFDTKQSQSHPTQGQPSSNIMDRVIIDPQRQQEIKKWVNTNYSGGQIQELIQAVNSPDVSQKHYGIIGIRKLLAVENDPPIQQVIDAGFIVKFIELSNQTMFPQLKLQAVWCMTNIASGTKQHCKKLVEKGALQLFVKLLQQNQKGVVDQALWAIGNLAADNTAYRNKILDLGGLTALTKVIQNSSYPTLIKNGTWSLTNLCRGSPLPAFSKTKDAIPIICKIIKSGIIDDKQILADCCWAISYMSQGAKSRIQRVLQTGALPEFIKFAQCTYAMLSVPALRIIGNFSTGNELQTEQLLKHNFFDVALTLLSSARKTTKCQTCYILSNIALGTASQVQQFLSRQDLLAKLVQMFETEAGQIRKQICWIFASFYQNGPKTQVLNILMQYDIIRYYINMLNEENQDYLADALETVQKIFKLGDLERQNFNNINVALKKFQDYGGNQKLQNLQFHQSKSVYNEVVKIIQTYYAVNEPDM